MLSGLASSTGARALQLIVVALAASACGGAADDDGAGDGPGLEDPAKGALVEDPGPVHVHGLGVNPADGALFVASHTGLFRAAKGERRAARVANRYQDTMAFTVVGPDRFLGSGHPDGREGLPPFLGLIESRDAGGTWSAVSLQGQVDFHVLEIRGRSVYGFGSDLETRRPRFMASTDRGRSWTDRKPPEPLVSLAIDPTDSQHLVAAGETGLYASRDAGVTWNRLGDEPGLLVWPRASRLYAIDGAGAVVASASGGRSWRAVGALGGSPAAFDPGEPGELLAALHDGTVKRSRDGGASWSVRSAP